VLVLVLVLCRVHQGMIFVPNGYSSPLLFNMEQVHGGSPWGAGYLAGADGSRMPSELELGVAKHQVGANTGCLGRWEGSLCAALSRSWDVGSVSPSAERMTAAVA
jgi:multimeric flavodoxin WrbA